MQEIVGVRPNLKLPPFPIGEHYLESFFSEKIETLEERAKKPVRVNVPHKRALLFSLWGSKRGIVFDGEGNPRGTLDERIIHEVGFRSMRDFGLNMNTLLSRDRLLSPTTPSIINETSVYPSRTEGLVFESIANFQLPGQDCIYVEWWVSDVAPRFRFDFKRLTPD